MPPSLLPVLQDVVRSEDPQKALFVVKSLKANKRKGMACSVRTESGRFFLVTCTDVAKPEDIRRNDGEGLVADRFCTRYPRHEKKHRRKIQDVRNDDKFSFILLSKSPDSTFQLYEKGTGEFENSCYSLAVIDNEKSKRIDWSYDNVTQRHVIHTDRGLGKSAIILGSPVLWTEGNKTFVVGVVGSDGDSHVPRFFDKNSPKIPGKKV